MEIFSKHRNLRKKIKMKLREICEKLRSGEMTLDYAGHRIGFTLEKFLERYDDAVQLSNGSNDGKWKYDIDTPEEKLKIDTDMRNFYTRDLDRDIKQEDHLRYRLICDHRTCFGCGEALHWVLTGNKLQLRNYCAEDSDSRFGIKLVNHPIDYVCPYANPSPFIGKIKVCSSLVIANYFKLEEDCPKEESFSEKYSLNNVAGRYNIAKYKESKNIAYGQMGNMSIGVYLNKEKTSIIIGPSYHYAEYQEYETEEEYEKAINKPMFDGYEQVGLICLDVWRWEATDLKTLGDKSKYIDKGNSVTLKVKTGDWTFQHNYDIIRQTDEDKFDYIFARLDLEK